MHLRHFSKIVIQADGVGNRTKHEGKSTDRIDGAVASWMAVSRATANEERSFYDARIGPRKWDGFEAYFESSGLIAVYTRAEIEVPL